MVHARHRRLLAVLLAAVVLLWPVAPPRAAVAHATATLASAATVDGCLGCDHGSVPGFCAATSCAVPPALVPAFLPDRGRYPALLRAGRS